MDLVMNDHYPWMILSIILLFLSPIGYVLRYLGLFIYLFHIISIDSSNMIGNFPEVLNFNWLFLKLNRFICKVLLVRTGHCE